MKQALLFWALLLVATYCYPQSVSALIKANYYRIIVFNGDTLNDAARLLTSRRYVIKHLSQDTLYSNTLSQFTTK